MGKNHRYSDEEIDFIRNYAFGYNINQILDVIKGFHRWKFAHFKNLRYNIGNKWERMSSLK